MSGDVDAVRVALPAYDIGGELGRGGWGVVLAGRHRQLERQVAIKQLPATFASDPAVRARFTTEARLLASMDHPHVVPVYDYVEQGGLCLLVMELLPGGTVWSRFTSAGFAAPSAVAVALAASAGLKAAHDRGVLHRDVKPENLMFSQGGAVKVTDFGIAKVIGGGETLATIDGEVLGTPAYIAPEQARGLALTPATDVYAVATMLYELLSGVLPFPDDGDVMSLLFRHAFEAPVPIEQVSPGIPAALASVVMRGLATDPAQRFATADAFGTALSSASASYWGPGWLAAQGVPVMGAETMTAGSAPQAQPTVTGGMAIPPPPPPPLAQGAPMRPVVTIRAPGVVLSQVATNDLLPLQQVVVPNTRVPLLVALGLAAITVVLAVVGLGAPSHGSNPPGAIILNAEPVSGSERVPLDLTIPEVIQYAGPSAADSVKVSLDVLGIEVESKTGPIHSGVAGVPALGGRYLVGGHLTAKVSVLDHGRVVATAKIPVRTKKHSAYLTAGAGVVLLLLLFAGAYVESNLRSLRKTKRRTAATVGATLASGVVGVAVVGASWIVLGREPTVPELIVCALVAAAAGAFAAVGCTRIGRRNRFRRRQARTAARG